MIKDVVDISIANTRTCLNLQVGQPISIKQLVLFISIVLIGPLLFLSGCWFINSILPTLSIETQTAINDGGPGMVLGMFGGGIVFCGLVMSYSVICEMIKHLKS